MRTARGLILAIGLVAGCGGPSAEDCTRVCTGAVDACSDKSIDKCVDRCESTADADTIKMIDCSGYGVCSLGLCCLGFYYSGQEKVDLCQ